MSVTPLPPNDLEYFDLINSIHDDDESGLINDDLVKYYLTEYTNAFQL
jgi:hypothetical protein